MSAVFADVLKAIESAPVAAARIAEATGNYERALQLFDFGFEFSDDARHVRRSREQLASLRDLQRTLDPDGVIWSRYAPAEYPPCPETQLRMQQAVSHG